MRFHPPLRPLALLLALSLPCTASPQSAPSASSQEQLQRERERLLRQQQEQRPDVILDDVPGDIAPVRPFPDNESPCRTIRAIMLADDADPRFGFALDSVTGVNGAIGRCLGSEGINTLLARVQNAVIARGYITTRVLAVPQDLSTGKLVLSIIAGRVRSIRFAPDADPRGTAVNALPLSPGDLLNLRDIEQGLENFKRIPTAHADIRITPAIEEDALPGDSDVVIQYAQDFPFRLSASLDDGGSHATGKLQAGITLAYDNWWTLNDLFYVSASSNIGHDGRDGQQGPRGSNSYTLHYSLPFGYWTVGATMSGSRYHQTVAGAFEHFVYSGSSENNELKLSRIVHRNNTGKTSLYAKALLRKAYSEIDGASIGPQQRHATAWEGGISHRHFIGRASIDLALAYRHALDHQGPPPASELDLPQISTRYGLWLADATLNAPFRLDPLALRYSSTLLAQWNRNTLPAQDMFSIGGRYTVRGFDGDLSLQAERGWFNRNELAVALGNSGQELYAAADIGQISGPGAQLLTGRRLAGTAVGLRGQLWKMSYDAFLATPLIKPEGFTTAKVTGGFSLLWSF